MTTQKQGSVEFAPWRRGGSRDHSGDEDHVKFKHEDSVDGMAVGPVWVVRDGDAQPHAVNSDVPVRWFGLSYAAALAEQLSLPLREV